MISQTAEYSTLPSTLKIWEIQKEAYVLGLVWELATSRGFLMSQVFSWGYRRFCRHCHGLRQGQGDLSLQSQKDSPPKMLLNTTDKSRLPISWHRPGPSSTTATWLGWGRKTTAQQNLNYLRWCYPCGPALSLMHTKHGSIHPTQGMGSKTLQCWFLHCSS